jgi:hypothetical protein
MTKKYRLDVFRDLDVDALTREDQRARDAAGIDESSAGANINARHLSFSFDSADSRCSAVVRLEDAGSRCYFVGRK